MREQTDWRVGFGDLAPMGHIIQFYDDESFLCGVVAEYLVEGARAGEQLFVIATAAHASVITAALDANGVDRSLLTLLDAEELLARLMVGESPDKRTFSTLIGEFISAVLGSEKARVRAYGEMVDLLVTRGNIEAAIALEEFWSDLASKQPRLSILCAHTLDNFYDESRSHALNEICRRHGRSNPAAVGTGGRQKHESRQVAAVQNS